MKRKLDLRTGTPVWSAYRAPAIPTSALTRDITADVLVVGMGISGAMIAEALTADGNDVVVIDRRAPMKGSTAATTALVMFEVDQPLSLLAEKIGKERAQRAWQRSRLALSSLRDRIVELDIDCQLSERPSVYLAGNVLDVAGLHAEMEARRAVGIFAGYLAAGPLKERYGIDRKGAILSRGDVTLDPRKLTSGMARAAIARGARVFAPVEATAIVDDARGVTVSTASGPRIRARHVVLATGYELTERVPADNHQIISTWAIATKPQPRALPPESPMIWEASDPYLYIRATSDGRIICGGEDEEISDDTERDALSSAKTKRLSEKLSKLLPGIDPTPDYAWSGFFGTTRTGLPFAGSLPRHPRIFSVMGYGGNGITWSQLGSEIIRTEIAGGRDADRDLFGFPR